jgi:hypothetical protein
MLAAFVTTEYRATVNFRMLAVPIATTLTAFVCFWSAGISVAIYLLLLPLYMLPGKFERKKNSNAALHSDHGGRQALSRKQQNDKFATTD